MTLRRLLPLLALLAVLLAACGDGGYGRASDAAQPDARALLDRAFDRPVRSGELHLAVNAKLAGTEADGPVAVDVQGPFDARGASPEFAFDASFRGAGEQGRAGLTLAGGRAFVQIEGRSYAVPQAALSRLQPQAFASLAADPRAWLTDPRVAGEATVGDAAVTRITAGVDVPRMLDDLDALVRRLNTTGLPLGGQIPTQISAADKRTATATIGHPRVEVDVAEDDGTLRRLAVRLDLRHDGGHAGIAAELTLTDVGAAQRITAPRDAQPLPLG